MTPESVYPPRCNEVKNMEKLQYILAGLIVFGFAVLTAVLFVPSIQTEMPKWVSDNMTAVFIAWVQNFTIVVGYYFGSSKGSSDKNALLTKK